MKLTHTYHAPAMPDTPENPRDDETRALFQLGQDRIDLMKGQLQELGRALLEHIMDKGPFIVEWQTPDELLVDPATVKVTIGVDVKRHREKKEDDKQEVDKP